MAEQTSRTELSVMVSPRASAPQTSEGELTGVKSEKQEALPQWPFSWLTSDALRGWYNSPHLALRDSVNHPATSAPEQRLQRAGVQGGVDAVTSIDRALVAFTLAFTGRALARLRRLGGPSLRVPGKVSAARREGCAQDGPSTQTVLA